MKAAITSGQLREQARLYESAAAKLRELADFMDGVEDGAISAHATPRSALSAGGGVEGGRGKPTRIEQVRAYLSENPGKKRRQIHLETGIPSGTVDMALKEKNGFRRDENGRWSVAD